MAKAPAKAKQKIPISKPTQVKEKRNYKNYLLALILIITGICYNQVPKHDFTNWDDEVYVTENHLLEQLSWKSIKTIFDTKSEVSLNYHPLTITSLAVNYHYSKLNPHGYLLTNIFIHLLNTLLVFLFIYALFDKNLIIAAFVATLFGVHPMHVESVAWVSERKDLLYGFFFISGLLLYLKYIETKQVWQLAIVLVLFSLSCLSKAMAASFAVTLPIIDYLKNRPFNKKVILEKMPFLIIALLTGLLAISIQRKEAINDFATFSLWERVMFASYGFVMYIIKLFVPANLTTFYPYPFVGVVNNLPLFYYIAPFIALAIVAVPLWLFYRLNKTYFKVYLSGVLFYGVTMVMVLQFISVGSAIMAERYTYIPYLGLTFIIGYFISEAITKYSKQKQLITWLSIAFCVVMAVVCYNRTLVWRNSLTLWNDVIAKYPGKVEVAYKNRGNYYARQGNYDVAYNDFIAAAGLNSKDPGVFSNLGNIYGIRKQFDKALDAYSKSLSYKKDNYDCRVNRGITYSLMKEYDKAIIDFDEAYKLNPHDDKLYQNRAFTYVNSGHYKEAIVDYTYLISRNPNDDNNYLNLGLAYFNQNSLDTAITYFKQAFKVNPKNAQAYFNTAFALSKKGKYKEALSYAQQANSMGMKVDERFMKELQVKGK